MQKNSISVAVLAGFALVAGCATTSVDHLAVFAPEAQLFEGMGSHSRKVSTQSREAQAYFNQGIAWMHAFNHDEAIRSFSRAAVLDPDCAMAWWGIALCEGPNYNDPVMTKQRSANAWAAIQAALLRIDNTTALERGLIEALAKRYAKREPKDRSELNQAYADAMAELWAAYPNDSDVGALYAEALMVQRPWKLYSADGEPEGDTPLIVSTLERVMEMDPGNPGANHLYIHAVEPSKTPEIGVPAADRLCDQVPGAGHLNHMPSHIYVQVGEWDKAIAQNAAAMAADAKYRSLSPDQGLQHMYQTHNAHMLAYSAMMVGREEEAMEAAKAMWSNIPSEVLEEIAGYTDLWMTSVYDVQKRFGRWDDILAEPAPPESLTVTCAVWRAHRAIAYAAKKQFAEAEQERALFLKAKSEVPEESVFGDDLIHGILDVSEHFIAGEIALQKGDWPQAIECLEQAVAAEDLLSYGEPPQWLQPTRHTLGAVYLKAGKYADAERVYREDLSKWRNNGWSLFGLSRALQAQGKTAEAMKVEARYQAVWAKADEPTTTSCKCLPSV